MDSTKARLAKCFVAVFPELTPQEALCASTTTMPEWDSVSSATLVSVIEEEFGIGLSIDALDEFGSFEQIFTHLQKSGSA